MDLPPASILRITLMVILMPRIVGCPKQTIGIDRYAVKFFQWMSPIHLKSQNYPLSRYIEQGLFVGEGVALFQQVGEGRAR